MYIIYPTILYDPCAGKLIGSRFLFPEGAQRHLPVGRWSSIKSKAMLRCAVRASAGVGPKNLDDSVVS